MEQTAPIPTMREALHYVWRVALLVRPYWRRLLAATAIGMAASMIALVVPYLTKLLIDDVYPSGDVNLLVLVVLASLAIGAAGMLIGTIRRYYSQVITTQLSTAMGLMFFNHLQHLPVSFFERHRVGEIMSRFQDVRGSLGAVSGIFDTLLFSGMYLLLVPPILMVMDVKLALVALMTLPITTSITLLSARLLRGMWKESMERYAEFSAFQVEALSHARTLKSLGAERFVFQKAHAAVHGANHAHLRAQLVSLAFGTLSGIVGLLGTAIFTWYAWRRILAGDITLGSFFAFSAYIGYVSSPLVSLINLASGFQRTTVVLGRMFEYLDMAPEQRPDVCYQESVGDRAPAPCEHLAVRGVSFGYTADQEVVRDVTVSFPAGCITAIVGPSGAGKSTLLRLLSRFDEPSRGVITMDDVPIGTIPLAAWRQQLGVVWQDTALLRGTLLENLTIGTTGVSNVEVERVLRICRLDTLIRELPEGLETPVAEWGASLSGGQRQRVSLARALLRRPSILLLDEPTANIDATTEEQMLRDLFEHVRGLTVLVVTHRIATAMLAPHIVVMREGQVEYAGGHADLLANSRTYRELAAASTPDARPIRVVTEAAGA